MKSLLSSVHVLLLVFGDNNTVYSYSYIIYNIYEYCKKKEEIITFMCISVLKYKILWWISNFVDWNLKKEKKDRFINVNVSLGCL